MKLIHNNAEEARILLFLIGREIDALPTDANPQYEQALHEIRQRVAKRGRIHCGGRCGLNKKGEIRLHIHTSADFEAMIKEW